MATNTNTQLLEHDTLNRPNILIGLIVGLLTTIALTAIFFLADAIVGLPFVPFDVLDWIARTLPGGLITFGIDTVVTLITTFQLGETSSAAKTAEHLMAIGGLIATGTVAAAVFFFVMNQTRTSAKNALPGLLLGLAVGIPVAIISASVNFTATTDPLLNTVWIVGVFAIWGALIGWIYDELTVETKAQTSASAQVLDRRSFLVKVGGATATITVLGAGLGSLLRPTPPQPQSESLAAAPLDPDALGVQPQDLPNAGDPVEPVPGTRPEYTPVEDHYRIDISARPPVLDEATYTLPIFGLVNTQVELTLADIRDNYEPMEQYVTLACISNRLGGDLTSTTKWTGVSMQQLLADVELADNAAYLRITSADGFDETLSLEMINEDERIMLAYAWDDAPLPIQNGFPLRIYIPDRFGMKQPKWITEIEVVEAYEEGYWVRRGWDEIAQMKTTSVIDTVATDAIVRRDGEFFVPVGGIAHAGARGISKVEVSVDDGDWQEAQLRSPLSETTWVIWRFEWPFVEGSHTFRVRTYDGNGTLQVMESQPSRPSGATGVHSLNATL